jgi:hypothetical protein
MIPGHVVSVIRVLGDGWAMGTDCTTGKSGMFPLLCFADSQEDVPPRAG